MLEKRLLRDLNLEGLDGEDGRRLEVVAHNLPLWNGAQLAVNATLVSPLRRDGTAYPRTAAENGVRLDEARRWKERKYPELLHSRRCRLVVTAVEIGGRWSEEAWTFLTSLAEAKSQTAPTVLQRSTQYCLLRRWSQMLAVAVQSAFASTLLGESASKMPLHNCETPEWGEMLCDREVTTEGPSRLL